MFDFLTDNLLIVCPNSYKLAILKYLNDSKKILNIKFMSKSEYKKSIKFDYGIDAIHFLKNKKMKVDNAITILDNLYYIENKNYNNDKLDYLVRIKNELDSNNLLIYDNLFFKVLKRRKLIAYGYGELNTFDRNLFSEATIIPYCVHNKTYDVYHFEYIRDEVEFVFQKICELLKDGININNISLMNVDSEYIPYLKRMSSFYNIKIDLDNPDSLIGTIIGRKFIDLIEKGNDANEILGSLKEYEENNEYSFLIDLLNKYSDYKLIDYIDEIKYDLLHHKMKKEVYENVVKVKDMFDYVSNDEYVFLMNFNSTSVPKLKMDTDYITDDICDLVGVDKKISENELIKKNTLNYLSSIKNIVISYKDKSSFNDYNPSFLLDDMKYVEIPYERNMNYSDLANKSIYSMYLDDLVKYGIRSDNLNLLYSSYDKNNYGEYNNQFSGINREELIKYLNKKSDKIVLSYSSIDSFYKCSFMYYLDKILRVNIFEKNFGAFVGNLFHHVLRKMNKDNSSFDFNEEYENYIKDNDYIKNHEFTDKEKFFLEKLKKDLEYIIDVVKNQQDMSGLTNILTEEEINIKIMDKPEVYFKGYVDKMMYKEKNGETLVSIIDYKTGKHDEVNIKNLEYGLTMQLPAYLYLANNYNKFENIKFTGFYLQHILNLNVKKKFGKTIDELKRDSLKLDGFSINDQNRLSVFDPTYEKSVMINGIKITKEGKYDARSKIVSDEEINELLNKTHEKIIEAMESIINGEFIINPKVLKNDNKSCKFCDFKDICYHTEKDIVYLDDIKNFDE